MFLLFMFLLFVLIQDDISDLEKEELNSQHY